MELLIYCEIHFTKKKTKEECFSFLISLLIKYVRQKIQNKSIMKLIPNFAIFKIIRLFFPINQQLSSFLKLIKNLWQLVRKERTVPYCFIIYPLNQYYLFISCLHFLVYCDFSIDKQKLNLNFINNNHNISHQKCYSEKYSDHGCVDCHHYIRSLI